MSRETTYAPLSIHELFALPVGATFVVYWAKDGDVVNALRLNYAQQTITANDGRVITTDDGYEWATSETVLSQDGTHYDYDTNVLDTSRGLAYFYKTMRNNDDE